jgi:hypothetical protein
MQIGNQIASPRWRSGRANSNHIPGGTKRTMGRRFQYRRAIDPSLPLAANFAVKHPYRIPCHDVIGCDPRIEGST